MKISTKDLPAIVEAASKSGWGIAALTIIALSILMYYCFGKSKLKVRLGAFGFVAAGFLLLGWRSIELQGYASEGLDQVEASKQALTEEKRHSGADIDFDVTSIPTGRIQEAGNIRTLLARLDKQFTVLIDAGHGGADKGATSQGIEEKSLTLEYANALQVALRKRGVNSLLTRDDDSFIPLGERNVLLAFFPKSVLVSLHANYGPDGKRGAEIFYNARGDGLADELQGEMKNLNEIPFNDTKMRQMMILRTSQRPSVLIEVGYLTNAEDRNAMLSEKFKLAAVGAIADGIVKWASQSGGWLSQ